MTQPVTLNQQSDIKDCCDGASEQTTSPTGIKPKKYLELEHIVKKYGTFTALQDISLTIYEGEFISFLGPSGCGKTTLLRAIAGLDYQTSGFLIQAGKDVSEQPPNKRDFGIVFQSYALFPNLTVADNVAYGLKSRHTPRSEITARVKELLETVGLPGSEHKYPNQLSGGQQQRVALARAIATSPGLLLLDEPLSALDAQVRTHLRSEIKALQARLGLTTIMVTHDQEEAMTMADRIVVMNHGVIEQVGTPEEIYLNPASPFVARFIGTTNELSGTVRSSGCVEVSGLQIKTECPAEWVGQDVILTLRPEDIRVRDISEHDQNTLWLKVMDMEFIGAVSRANLLHNSGLKLKAEFSRNDMRDLDVQVGKMILVQLDQLSLFLRDSI